MLPHWLSRLLSRWPFLAVVSIIAVGTCSWIADGAPKFKGRKSPEPKPAAEAAESALRAQGRFLFERHCMVCHGRWGDGKGEMAAGMKPKPRNFSSAIFKFRSTPSGFLPTDEDLGRTIRQGISLSSMPAFANLRDPEIDALVVYIKSFSRQWSHAERLAPAVALPATPDWFYRDPELEQHAATGRQLFERNCSACHGIDGSGHGPASPALEDAWGEPCPPPDLHLPYARGGSTVRDLFRSLTTGIDGTPMPSFVDTATELERWDLVAFIETLRKSQKTDSASSGAGNLTPDTLKLKTP